MYARIVADSLILASILWLPWWVTLLLAAVFFFRFTLYYELVLAGIFIDVLYAPSAAEFPESFLFTGLFSLIFLLLHYGRHYTKFNRTL